MGIVVHSADELKVAKGMAEALAERMSVKYDMPDSVTNAITQDIYESGIIKTVLEIVGKRVNEWLNENE